MKSFCLEVEESEGWRQEDVCVRERREDLSVARESMRSQSLGCIPVSVLCSFHLDMGWIWNRKSVQKENNLLLSKQ